MWSHIWALYSVQSIPTFLNFFLVFYYRKKKSSYECKHICNLLHQPRSFQKYFLLKYTEMCTNILTIYILYTMHTSAEIYKAVYISGVLFLSTIYFLLAIFEALVIEESRKRLPRVCHREALPRSLNSMLEKQSRSFMTASIWLISSATLLLYHLFLIFF